MGREEIINSFVRQYNDLSDSDSCVRDVVGDMVCAPAEREFLAAARVGRLATADGRGRPHAVPICYAWVGDWIATPIDEKPKTASATDLRRVRDVESNPFVALVVDRYTEEWSALGWVQVRGRARIVHPDEGGHDAGIASLREKYDQYRDHDLEARPLIRIDPGEVVSWGSIEEPPRGRG